MSVGEKFWTTFERLNLTKPRPVLNAIDWEFFEEHVKDSNSVVTFLCASENDHFEDGEWHPQEENVFSFDYPSLESLFGLLKIKKDETGRVKDLIVLVSSIMRVCLLRIARPLWWTIIFASHHCTGWMQIYSVPPMFLELEQSKEEVKAKVLRRYNIEKKHLAAVIRKYDPIVRTMVMHDWASRNKAELETNLVILYDAFRSRRCAHCYEVKDKTETYRCSVCEIVSYCNSECQLAHWKIHKLVCRPCIYNATVGINLKFKKIS